MFTTQQKKPFFFEGKSYQTRSIVISWNEHPTSLFKKRVETNCSKSQRLAKKQWKLYN